jgi:hypothetical protein
MAVGIFFGFPKTFSCGILGLLTYMFFTFFLNIFIAPLLVGLFGLLTGSYLNSWIWRVHHNVWRLAGRSTCVHCLRELVWFENIPLISFIVLGGRCRTCRKRIPQHYFFVELVTAVLFFGVTWYHQTLPVLSTWHFFRDIFFVVLFKPDNGCARPISVKVEEVSEVGATKGINRLRIVSDYADVVVFIGKKPDQLILRSVDVFIKGPGAGRDAALRALKSAGLNISMIADVTPMPHNGVRAKKKRRV